MSEDGYTVIDASDAAQVKNPIAQGWKGLKLKMREGLDSAGRFYSELVSQVGEVIAWISHKREIEGCGGCGENEEELRMGASYRALCASHTSHTSPPY
ncbi:hypothetical protein [Nostoc sp.]|uniref:hypothetical protein n=1 Tax=Nostoc sp. TaxID=1180 RepID=UPI002FFCF6B9